MFHRTGSRIYAGGLYDCNLGHNFMQQKRIHTSDSAVTMSDVRYEVDRLDSELVKLLAERQSFMRAAARIKGQRHKVHDRERIEDVVSKVLDHAANAGLSSSIAEPVWRTLIDRCIAYEFEAFDELTAGKD